MFTGFVPYVEHLESIAQRPAALLDIGDLSAHLDGEAGRQLRGVVKIEDLRRAGAFFTGEALANRLISLVPHDRQRYVDVACGCGDLLLAASTRLRVERTLERTMKSWNRQLLGRDLVPAFVRAARARLVLAALSRGALPTEGCARPADLLSNIAVGDGLSIQPLPGDGVLLNPPYGRVVAPARREWTSGLTTQAALFLDELLDGCDHGVYIAAVLPEVLRSGSRYGRFRAHVERRVDVKVIEPAGLFDALTDVDVFLLSGDVGDRQLTGSARWTPKREGPRLADICEISVGALVAYRDPARGLWRAYIDAQSCRGADETIPEQRRRFRGAVVNPPFVVVGRTNRPTTGSAPRLRATIVRGKRPVAVENHLLVLRPQDHTLRGCRTVMGILESEQASLFLDERLRCRHLTVDAVREIPR
jgi:hypothetical protein